MSENKGTVYQKLDKHYKDSDNTYTRPVLSAPMRIKSKSEYERVNLEKQQTSYLRNAFKKIKSYVTQQSMVYESQRIPLYLEYQQMEQYELIGKALELYAEECCVLNEKSEVLNIFSQNKRVEEELRNLFYNVLKVNINLHSWVYQLVKMGDCMVHWNLDDELGVIGYKQLPVMDVERVEGDYMQNLINADMGDGDTVFRWKTSHMIEFKHWQVGHFRLLMDQQRIPYGVSMLEKARRLWSNLMMSEDAMIAAQLLRGMDRFVYYVEVGGIDPHDVEPYVQEVMSRFKRQKKIDPHTGQVDMKYNVMTIDQDYVIPKRGNDDGSKVEKIEGQANLDTAVVDYLIKKLIAALGIPAPFLNFEESTGDGKNLSMQDIRFARTIQRIQQAVLLELNKVAVTHLYLCGMENEVDNFSLSMNSPSKQTEVLDIEILQARISLYHEATDFSNGIAAMSSTEAKQRILKMTKDEIIADLKQQYIERATFKSLESAGEKITDPEIFQDIIDMYGNESMEVNTDDEEEGDGGGFGGGSLGGDIDLSDDENFEDTDLEVDDSNDSNNTDIESGDDIDLTENFSKIYNEYKKLTLL